jgi:hypothetical protein
MIMTVKKGAIVEGRNDVKGSEYYVARFSGMVFLHATVKQIIVSQNCLYYISPPTRKRK